MGAKKPRDLKWYSRLSKLFASCGSKSGDGDNARALLDEMLAVNGLTWNDLPDLLAEAARQALASRPSPQTASPPSVDEGDCQPSQPFTTTIPVTPSLPQGDPDQGPPDGSTT